MDAAIQFKVFCENVDKLHDTMMDEITATLSDWLDFSDQLQSGDKFAQLILVKVQEFCRKLTVTGLERLIDMGNALKLADDEWRADNPELSTRFPPED